MTALLNSYADSVIETIRTQESYKDLFIQRSPPGYPLGYIREKVRLECHCGNVVLFSRLLVVERSTSKGRKVRPCGMNETVYDLEIAEVTAQGGTPRCELCIDSPREALPKMPGLQERLGHARGDKELDLDDLGEIEI